MVDRCPKCGEQLQEIITVDEDDKPVSVKFVCKKIFKSKRKKGCGYFRKETP